jgi:L-ascorbate oxidase
MVSSQSCCFVALILQIRVTNMHPTEGVAIHWHGIHQKGTPYMDGPIGITQCALGSKQSQEYVFAAYPPGTHYWHAHGSLHLADGLSGPIVVHPKDPEPFKYDDDRILFLQDWYIQTSTQQVVGLLNFPFTWVGNPNSLLINGKGLAPECLANGTNVGNVAVCLPTCQDDPATQLEVVSVEALKTYRLRLINGGQLVSQRRCVPSLAHDAMHCRS